MPKLSEIGTATIATAAALLAYQRAMRDLDLNKTGPGDVSEKRAVYDAAVAAQAALVTGYAANPQVE